MKKVIAFNGSHTPLSLSNFVAYNQMAEELRVALTECADIVSLAKKASAKTYYKWTPHEDTEDYMTIVSVDPLGNRRYIKVTKDAPEKTAKGQNTVSNVCDLLRRMEEHEYAMADTFEKNGNKAAADEARERARTYARSFWLLKDDGYYKAMCELYPKTDTVQCEVIAR